MFTQAHAAIAVRTALAVTDPMGLLALGCPEGEYDLTVETDGDPSLTLVADDENVYTTTVTSTASLDFPPK